MRKLGMFKQTLALGAIVTLVAGCAGGNGTATVPAVPPVPASTTQAASTVSITIGGSSARSIGRHAKYVSPSTQGASIAVNAQAAVLVDLSSASKSCTANPDGSRTCSVGISAPIGTDSFVLSLYDAVPANGAVAGSLLSTSSFTSAIVSGSNAIKVAPNGVPASVLLALSNAAPPVGAAATITLTATAKDADGNIIIGNEIYASPIVLTSTDTSGAVTLGATSLASPSSSIAVTYTGADIAKVTFGAAATGLAATAITGVTFAPQSARPSVAGDTYTIVSSGTTTSVYRGGTPRTSQSADQTQVTVSTGVSYDGKTALIKRHQVTSTDSAFVKTNDFYVQNMAVGSRLGQYKVGYVSDETNADGPAGSSVTNQSILEDEMPETLGDAWVANPQYNAIFYAHPTSNNSSANHYDITQNVAADGSIAYVAKYPSYSETDTQTNNADGTGVFSLAYADGITPINTYAFGKPVASATGSMLPIVRSATANTPINGSSPAPAPSPTTFMVPNWYPGGTPTTYDRIVAVNNGTVALPAECPIKTVSGNASSLTTTETQLDVTAGLIVSATAAYAVPGVGVVCTISDYKATFYYQYGNGGTSDYFYTSGVPNYTSTTHTVAALQQTSLLSLMRHPLGIGSASLIAMPGMAVHRNGAHVPGKNR